MKPGRGKAKGSAFEREICKALSLWVTHGEKDDCFWRSAISGGRATVARKKGKVVRQDGDITAVSPEGHSLTDRFFIECKHVKKLGLDQFLVKRTGLLAEFWKKAREQSGTKWPIIIAKQNQWPILVISEVGGLVGLTLPPRIPLISHRSAEIWLLGSILRHPYRVPERDPIAKAYFDDFAKNNPQGKK